jgi:tetratricopeptide (TPR) repeat protein
MSSGRTKEAIVLYKQALELNPENFVLCIELGNAYMTIGKFQEAIPLFKKVLEHNPNLAVAHNNLAVAHYFTGQYDLAIKHCDKAVELGYKVEPRFLDWLKPYRKQIP